MIELANHSFEITQDVIKNYNKVVVSFNNLEKSLKYSSKDWIDQLSIIWYTNEYLLQTATNKYTSGLYSYNSIRAFQDFLNDVSIGGGSVNCPSDCGGYCGSYHSCSTDCGCDDCSSDGCDCGSDGSWCDGGGGACGCDDDVGCGCNDSGCGGDCNDTGCGCNDTSDCGCDDSCDSNVICTYISERLFTGDSLYNKLQMSRENVQIGIKSGVITSKQFKEYYNGLGLDIIGHLKYESDETLYRIWKQDIAPIWIELRTDPINGTKQYVEFVYRMAKQYDIDCSKYPHLTELFIKLINYKET